MPAVSRTITLYTCSCCGVEDEWRKGWIAKMGRPASSREAAKYVDPEPVDYACPKPECQAWIRAKYARSPADEGRERG